jgi:hypothetical protein
MEFDKLETMNSVGSFTNLRKILDLAWSALIRNQGGQALRKRLSLKYALNVSQVVPICCLSLLRSRTQALSSQMNLKNFQVFLAPNQNLKNKKGMINVRCSYAGSFSMPTKFWDAGASVGELALDRRHNCDAADSEAQKCSVRIP